MEVSTSLRRQRNTTNYSDQELYETFGLPEIRANYGKMPGLHPAFSRFIGAE